MPIHAWYSKQYNNFYCSYDLYRTISNQVVKVTHVCEEKEKEVLKLPKDAQYVGIVFEYLKSITLLTCCDEHT